MRCCVALRCVGLCVCFGRVAAAAQERVRLVSRALRLAACFSTRSPALAWASRGQTRQTIERQGGRSVKSQMAATRPTGWSFFAR